MNALQRLRFKLPKYMNNEWLAAGVHMRDKKLPPAFDEDGKYIDIEIGDIMPMKELSNGKYAYYRVIKGHIKQGGDWLYDTDKWTYDMQYSHIGNYKIRW